MGILYVKIKNGRISITDPDIAFEIPGHYKIVKKTIRDILLFLTKSGYIKETEFILGFTDSLHSPDNATIPLFVFSKDAASSKEKNHILIPDWVNLRTISEVKQEQSQGKLHFPWHEKKSIALWRGGPIDSTGFRKKIVAFSKLPHNRNLIDAEFAHLNSEKYLSKKQQVAYKYLLSIDGASSTWERLVWQLHSNSLVFKQNSTQMQWFYRGLNPFKHFIPINDEADVLEKISWAETHPDEVQGIINNANQFSEQNLTLEDFCHYLIILLEEYRKRVEVY